jgi:hypothetical protein
MAILDDLLDTDHEALWAATACPAWVVACLPAAGATGADAEHAAAKQAALTRAAQVLPDARLQQWHGALHDVPLQWPALVAGLVRAAHDEVVHAGRRGEGERT